MAQETQTGALYHLEGWDGEGDGREVQKGGDIWIPMAEVWQKTTKFCKAIILQLKNTLKNFKGIGKAKRKKKSSNKQKFGTRWFHRLILSII